MKRKVLFLIESLSGGGAEKVLSTIAQLLDKDRFEVTVCPIVDCGVHAQAVKAHADHYLPLLPNPEKLSSLKKLKYQLLYSLIYKLLPLSWVYRIWIPKNHNVEVAFVEGFVTKLLAHSSNKHSQKIAWVHIDLEQFHWTKALFSSVKKERETYQSYDKVVCVSETVRLGYERKFNHLKNSHLCYNPLNIDEIISKSQDKSSLPPKTEGKLRLITAGRLVPQKGFSRLINAIDKICKKGIDVELFIFGEGELRKDLETQIETLNLSEKVHLQGFNVNHLKDLRTADLFVCSSIAEGYSLVIAEALVQGIPVLSTYCSGPNELLQEGKSGLLCENSEAGLTDAIFRLSSTPELLAYYKELSNKRGNDLRSNSAIKKIEDILQ
jgi:glycosyltransferase involved in cell wall biosynthesis